MSKNIKHQGIFYNKRTHHCVMLVEVKDDTLVTVNRFGRERTVWHPKEFRKLMVPVGFSR